MGSDRGEFWLRIDRSSRFGHQSWFDMLRTMASLLTRPPIGHLLSAFMTYSHGGLWLHNAARHIVSRCAIVQSIKSLKLIEFFIEWAIRSTKRLGSGDARGYHPRPPRPRRWRPGGDMASLQDDELAGLKSANAALWA